jgi:hypothetical protein
MLYNKKLIIFAGLLMSASISATDPDLEKWFRTQEKKVSERAALVNRLAERLNSLDQKEKWIPKMIKKYGSLEAADQVCYSHDLAGDMKKIQNERQEFEETYPAPILRDAENMSKCMRGECKPSRCEEQATTVMLMVPRDLIMRQSRLKKYLRREGLTPAQRKRVETAVAQTICFLRMSVL